MPITSRLLIVLATAFLLVSACGADGDEGDEASAGGSDDSTQTDDGDSTGDGGGAGDDDGADGGLDRPVGFEDDLTVVVPNSPGTLSTSGDQRVMTALIGTGPNAYLGGEDQPVTVRFEHVDGDTVGEARGEWLTTNASALGLYVSSFAFDAPGLWEIFVSADGVELGAALVEVVADSTVPNIGDPAPPSKTLTGTTPEEIAAISTDQDPIADLYDLSIDEAVANGRPTVIAFATPAFCQTALCGPTLEFVKGATAGRDDIDVVHVEPFDLELAPQGTLEPIPSMFDWGLVTEPWVFVVDGDGIVTATFEGIIGQAEIEAAIDAL